MKYKLFLVLFSIGFFSSKANLSAQDAYIQVISVPDVSVGKYDAVFMLGNQSINYTFEIEQNRNTQLFVNTLTNEVDQQSLLSDSNVIESKNSDRQSDVYTEIVDVYNPVTGRTWMDRNLGASRMAQSSTDEEAYGDLYQWGRAADGHEKRNSRIYHADYRYIDNSNTNTPGHGYFITGFITDWRNPRNDTLWQGSKGINNPCPEDYRLPTKIEWEEEILSWKSKDAAGAFASPLKLPTAGFRDNREDSRGLIVLTGPLYGAFGGYWSSTI